MSNLVQLAIDAHGGLERWRRLTQVTAHLRNGGVLWSLKHPLAGFGEVNVRSSLHHQWASHSPFGEADLRTSFEPSRVAVETMDGRVIEERLAPRDSFAGHRLETPWDRLQLAYFAGYAMWTYFTTPFLFAMEGIAAEEIGPWREGNEVWRRLSVTFPARIASHSTVQTFYFDSEGLLKRHDYDADVLAGTPAAHYVYDYQTFSGILVPTKRRVFGRRPDGTPVPEPLIVTIDLSEVQFS